MYKISKEQLADYKELFTLFARDMNGVLSFAELGTAMKTLGQRLPGKYQKPISHRSKALYLVEADLLSMVRAVSEDKLYDTMEFNEFLKMMSKQQSEEIPENALVEAFK